MDDYENDPDVKRAQERVWIITDPSHPWHDEQVHLLEEQGRPVGICHIKNIRTGEEMWGTMLQQMEILPK